MRFDNGEQIEIYQDKAGKWRWRLRHDNTQIIGASTQGYSSKESCIDNLKRVVFTNREDWEIY